MKLILKTLRVVTLVVLLGLMGFAVNAVVAQEAGSEDANAVPADSKVIRAKVIRAGTVLTMNGEPLSPGQVLVVDGKIKAIAGQLELPSDAEVIDLGDDGVLMPGLIDACSQSGVASDGTDEITSEVNLDFQVVDSIDWDRPLLRRQMAEGTTTMCLSPGSQSVIAGQAAVIKTDSDQMQVLQDNGPWFACLCNDPTAGNRSRTRPDGLYVRQPTNRMGVVWILRKTMDTEKGQAEASPLHSILNGQKSLWIYSRLTHDLQTVDTLQKEIGYRPVIVGGQEAYQCRQMLAERGYPVVLENISTGRVSGPEQTELCWNNAGLLDEAGVSVSLSGGSLLEQARFAVRHGMNKESALAAITTRPAQLLGLGDRIGKIAEGMDADLIALSGDPLELSSNVRWVMVNGQVVELEKE